MAAQAMPLSFLPPATAGNEHRGCQESAGVVARMPHEVGSAPVDYRIVVPTRGRWRPASAVASKERKLKDESKPFILVKTLDFLKRQQIPPNHISLWTADDEEKSHYEKALLTHPYWRNTGIEVRVGVPGIRDQRNFIVNHYPEGTYIVSLDDDISEVFWKRDIYHRKPLVVLPSGGFVNLIYHGFKLMREHKAWIWGLSTTCKKNMMSLRTDGVSSRNGEINGFLYGFINRHDAALQPSLMEATEDAERSLRYFAKDKIILRYRMYCCETRCYQYSFGLQGRFEGPGLREQNCLRKEAEHLGAEKLHEMFPSLTGTPKPRKMASTLEVTFLAHGGPVIPTSSVRALKAAIAAEREFVEKLKSERAANSSPSRRLSFFASSKSSGLAAGEQRSSEAQSAASSAGAFVLQSYSSSSASFRAAPLQIEDEIEDSDEEALGDEAWAAGDSENDRFEQVIGVCQDSDGARSEEEEAEMIRRAIERSMLNVEKLINGDDVDPMARAIEESEKLDQDDKCRRARESEEIAEAMRLSRLDAGLPEQPSGQPELGSLPQSISDDSQTLVLAPPVNLTLHSSTLPGTHSPELPASSQPCNRTCRETRSPCRAVLHAAKQYLRCHKEDEIFMCRRRVLNSLSKEETEQFIHANVSRRHGNWVWDIVDRHVQAERQSSMAIASEESAHTAATASSVCQDGQSAPRKRCRSKMQAASSTASAAPASQHQAGQRSASVEGSSPRKKRVRSMQEPSLVPEKAASEAIADTFSKVNQLVEMGFEEESVKATLIATAGDVRAAAMQLSA